MTAVKHFETKEQAEEYQNEIGFGEVIGTSFYCFQDQGAN